MAYRVQLPVFSGPLDLLLHLIRQQEVDIHEVSISAILDQYLQHLSVLQELDLGDLGDFVVMASTLMEIKSRELLPREEVSVEEELDPRDELIQRLLEYKRYRDLSRRFERLSQRRERMLSVQVPVPRGVLESDDDGDELDLGDVEIWALTAAFAKLLAETGVDRTLHVGVEKRGVRFYIERVLSRVRAAKDTRFEDLFERGEGRYGLIGTFATVLELMKQGFLRAHQESCSSPIVIAYVGPADLTPDDVMSGAREQVAAAAGAEAPSDVGVDVGESGAAEGPL